MRIAPLAAALLFAATTTVTAQQHDPDQAVKGGGTLPPGWMARTDRGAPMDNVKAAMEDGNLHVTLGPAIILYQPSETVSGSFEAGGLFHQFSSGRHAEGLGIIVGGKDLQGDGQAYTYFLVRGDGKFLVVKRDGEKTARLIPEWTANDAVKAAPDTTGHAMNRLAVAADGKTVRFLVNGTEVYSAPASEIATDGIVGFRINHNLDVRVDGWKVAGK